jgi:antitoxin component YwqK of YwqJK toxin-antitoxin module
MRHFIFLTAIALFLVFFASVPVFAQQKVYILGVDTYYDKQTEALLDLDGKLATGIVKGYSDSGKIKVEIPYKNDKAEGLGKVYFLNGAILELVYKNDEAVSGVCIGITGKTPLTSLEITYWNNGEDIECE